MKNIVKRLVGWGLQGASRRVSPLCALFMLGFAVLMPQGAEAAQYSRMGNDRILLMNNYDFGRSSIRCQGYWDTNELEETYWVHEGSAHRTYSQGTNHVMYAKDKTIFWRLLNCRAGAASSGSQSYIPASIHSAESVSPSGQTVANTASIIMRNTLDSQVVSPYYKDGIGTIYFDVVNHFNEPRAALPTIELQIATNVAQAVQEENPNARFETTDAPELLDWQTVPLTVFVVTNGILNETASVVEALEMNAPARSAGKFFYRVRTTLNCRVPARFRIKRTTIDTTEPTKNDDQIGLIIVDNLVASYPVMSFNLKTYGLEYDTSRRGKEVLGRVGDFNVPFLALDQEGVQPVAFYEHLTNGAPVAAVVKPILKNPRLCYRWRYLTQLVGDWQTLPFEIVETNNTLVAQPGATVSLTNGVGDLEYYFVADVSSVFYSGLDFTFDTKVGWGVGWTEEITAVTNRGVMTNPVLYNSMTPTPAGGTDYFVRIREGESDYERVDFCAYLGTNTFATTNYAMELVSDHTWRYHYHMPTNLANAGQVIGFSFNAVNKQTPGATVYARNNTPFKLRAGVAQIRELPFTSVADANTGVDGTVAMTNAATHLVVEFNDETGAFTISRGGYQDFNAWTDAKGSQYVGNYVTTSGVSDVKTLYTCDFNTWGLSLGTNSWWSESFGHTSVDLYPFDQYFQSWRTPNGWWARNGMFVSTDRTNKVANVAIVDSATRAFQMDGGGVGSIELSDLPANGIPQGVDTFSFKARVAQSHDFGSFVYAQNNANEKGYAFSAEVAMSVFQHGTDMSLGTPSVSLVGYHRERKGCYEFRIRRLTGSGDSGSAGRLELSIWKWKPVGDKIVCELLTGGTVAPPANGLPSAPTPNPLDVSTDASQPAAAYQNVNNLLVPTDSKYAASGDYANWTSCYISIYSDGDGKNHILGAMAKARNTNGVEAEGDSGFVYIYCQDLTDPLKSGSFGVGATDCVAHFGKLQKHKLAGAGVRVNFNSKEEVATQKQVKDDDSWLFYDDTCYFFSKASPYLDIEGGTWYTGFKFKVPEVMLEMSICDPSEATKKDATWQRVAVTNVASFKMSEIVFQPQITDLCYVRLATTDEGISRAGAVVDDLEVRQWRGETDKVGSIRDEKAWTYTEGWIVSNGVVATDRALKLQPKRGSGEVPMGLRTPLLKQGLSLFSFAYTNADENASLLLQIATNRVTTGGLEDFTESLSAGDWTTVTNFSFKEMTSTERLSGALAYSMSLRAPVSGLIRLIVDPTVIAAASVTNVMGELPPSEFGQVTITSALCYDEPPLDDRSWWGWNLLTTGWDSGVANAYAYLTDWSTGLSAGLNWSGTTGDNDDGAELKDAEKGQYQQHDPFIQSPPLECGIGSVSFRARKMYGADQNIPSVIQLQGAADKNAQDSAWEKLATFTVDSPTYQTFTWTTTSDESAYKVIRLVVPGVRNGRDKAESQGQRVLIDEVTMAEPISPKIAFINLAPFRTDLDQNVVITNILSMDQQPLLGESFGFQVEIEPQQMSDQLDLDRVRVFMGYHVGYMDAWGFDNWKRAGEEVELTRMGTNLIFRSTYDNAASIVQPQNGRSVVVQYYVRAVYWDKGTKTAAPQRHEHFVTAKEWAMPTWYRGEKGDLNQLYGYAGFSPYTILESVSPRRAWINEVNFYDGLPSTGEKVPGLTNQYVEVAVPAGCDLTGWYLEVVDNWQASAMLANFGRNGVSVSKTENATNRYVFLTVRSPDSTTLTHADGVWNKKLTSNMPQGQLHYDHSYALRLVRPSGIWEHEIVFAATNTTTSRYWYTYEPTNLCAKLNQADANARFCVVGWDRDAGSLGVYRSHGENGVFPDDVTWQDVTQCSWTNSMRQTPTRVNQLADGTLQDIDENYYLTPNGTNMWIYADVSGGNILMKFGTNLVEHAVIVLPMEHSTNIVFVLDRWYEVASLTTNGVAVDVAQNVTKETDGTFSYKIANIKSQVNLLAKAGPGGRMRDLGVSESRYRDAIMHWMQQYDDTEDIHVAKFRPLSKFSDTTGASDVPLSLVDMYWLNISPIEPGWLFVAGIGGWGQGTEGSPVVAPYEYRNPVTGDVGTNVTIRMTMFLTNTVSRPSRAARAPDRLQGLEPGSTSYDSASGTVYDPSLNPNWTSVTFKVTGALQNGAANNTWLPLRWFVFGPDSFDENFTATIDIHDPFKPDSSTATAGWGKYRGTPIFYRWAIDDARKPVTTEMLKSDSRFSIHPDKTNP